MPFSFETRRSTRISTPSSKCNGRQQQLLPPAGPASAEPQLAQLLFAPNTTATQSIMHGFAQAAACPADPAKKAVYSNSFFYLFRSTAAQPDTCSDQVTCRSTPACYQHVLDSQLHAFATGDEAVSYTQTHPQVGWQSLAKLLSLHACLRGCPGLRLLAAVFFASIAPNRAFMILALGGLIHPVASRVAGIGCQPLLRWQSHQKA